MRHERRRPKCEDKSQACPAICASALHHAYSCCMSVQHVLSLRPLQNHTI